MVLRGVKDLPLDVFGEVDVLGHSNGVGLA